MHPNQSNSTRLARRAICLAALALAGAAASAQALRLSPGAEVLEGQPLEIRIEQLPPGATVTLVASRTQRSWGPWGRTQIYQSRAVFHADPSGRVDVTTQAPDSGTYSGVDLRGPFWSMTPLPAAMGAAAAAAGSGSAGSSASAPAGTAGTSAPASIDATTLPPGRVRLQVLADGKEVATQDVTLRRADADLVQRQPEDFPGARFAVPAGAGRKPAVILLGGSEGGAIAARNGTASMASLGYAVLGLPYYSPPVYGNDGKPGPGELPQLPRSFAEIDVAQLERAREWLARQPEVDASRIVVYGVSKGAEYALIAAARMPWIRGVVAVVPSDVVWEAWGPDVPEADKRSSFSYRGQPLPFVPYRDMPGELAGLMQGKPVILRRPQDNGRADHPDRVPAARIEVERFAGPMLLIGGTDDQIWDSAGMARNIAATRRAKGLPTELAVYEGAGHFITGTGWEPATQFNAGPFKSGGTPEKNARAAADAWLRTQAFLRKTLKD